MFKSKYAGEKIPALNIEFVNYLYEAKNAKESKLLEKLGYEKVEEVKEEEDK